MGTAISTSNRKNIGKFINYGKKENYMFPDSYMYTNKEKVMDLLT